MSQSTFTESVNAEYCQLLAKLSFSQFMEFYPVAEQGEDGVKTELYIQYNMLRSYCKDLIKNDYKRISHYDYTQNKKEGRIFLKETTGLQRIWNKFRGVLCDGLMLDLDMINAHPTLLLHICKQNGILAIALETYVVNRTKILEQLFTDDGIEKGDAKLMFIVSINDYKPIKKLGSIKIKNPFFLSYDKEIKNIQKQLCQKYTDLFTTLSKKNKENVEGKLLNHLMCGLENAILQKAITKVEELAIEVAVPMFDGMMVYQNSLNEMPLNTLIDNLNDITKEYGIKWSNKEHNVELLEHLQGLTFDDNKYSFVAENEVELVEKYIIDIILKNKIYNCDGEIYLYNKQGKVWTTKKVSQLLVPLLSCHDLYFKKQDKYIHQNKSNNNLKNLVELVMAHAPQNPNFTTLMFDSTLHKLCYKNGFYDFEKGDFVKYTEDNIPFTTFIINRDYVKDDTKEEEIYKRIFYPMFDIKTDQEGKPYEDEANKNKKQYMEYLLYVFARAMAGHVEDKRWLALIGERNSGKGVLYDFFKKAFEDYVGMFETGNLIAKTSLGEATKEFAWKFQFEFKRAVFGSELFVKLDKRGQHEVKLNGTLIKSISSGGDEHTARGNFKDERTFNIQATMILCANDLLAIEPADASNTLERFNMTSTFLDENEEKLFTDKQKETMVIYKKDTSLRSSWCKEKEVINSFTNIIFKAYAKKVEKPSSFIQQAREEHEDDSEYERFLNIFTVDGSDNFVSNKRIEELMATHRISYSNIKAGKILVGLGCIRDRDTSKRGLKGLKINN